jgi:hypothetical protein
MAHRRFRLTSLLPLALFIIATVWPLQQRQAVAIASAGNDRRKRQPLEFVY